MVSYSIHVIAEYNLSGSKIICRQIYSDFTLRYQLIDWLDIEKLRATIRLSVKNSAMQDFPRVKHIITDVINYQYAKHEVIGWNTSSDFKN